MQREQKRKYIIEYLDATIESLSLVSKVFDNLDICIETEKLINRAKEIKQEFLAEEKEQNDNS